MSSLATNSTPNMVTGEYSLLDSIVEQSRVARTHDEHDRAKSLIGELAKEVMAGTITISENMTLSIDKRIAEMGELAVSGNVYICFSRKMPCKQGL